MLHYKTDFRSDRAACGALISPRENTIYPAEVQCPACLAIIRENKAQALGLKVIELFEFHPGERVISAGQYHDCIIITTTDRVWRMDCPDVNEAMKIQVISELRHLIY